MPKQNQEGSYCYAHFYQEQEPKQEQEEKEHIPPVAVTVQIQEEKKQRVFKRQNHKRCLNNAINGSNLCHIHKKIKTKKAISNKEQIKEEVKEEIKEEEIKDNGKKYIARTKPSL